MDRFTAFENFVLDKKILIDKFPFTNYNILMKNTIISLKSKRIGGVFLFALTLLFFASCGSAFNSKQAQTANVSLSIPESVFRAVTGDSSENEDQLQGELKISLFVNDSEPVTQTITNFSQSQTITFKQIPIGASVKASAIFRYKDKEYTGESEQAVVTEEGAKLSLSIVIIVDNQEGKQEDNQEGKQEDKQEDKYPMTVTPTEEGNVITVSNLPVGEGNMFWIYCNITGTKQNDRLFNCNQITKDTYTFTDKYVKAGEERIYILWVHDEKSQNYQEGMTPVKVTSIGGEEYLLSANQDSYGIKLDIQTSITDNIIVRREIKEGEIVSSTRITLKEEGDNSIVDRFLMPGNDYVYLAAKKDGEEIETNLYYLPISNIITVTPAAGFGAIKLNNKPAGTFDKKTKLITFTTTPGVSVPDLSESLVTSLGVQLKNTRFIFKYREYWSDDGWAQYDFIYIYNGNNTLDVDVLRDSSNYGYPFRILPDCYGIYFEEGGENLSYKIDYYDSSIDLSGMPQELLVTAEDEEQGGTQEQGETTTYQNYYFYYDDIFLYKAPDDVAKAYVDNKEMMTQYYTISEDKILFTDVGLETSFSEQDEDGNTIPIVAYAIYNKTLVMPLNQEDFTLYQKRMVEDTDYKEVLKGQKNQFIFLDLTETGYQKHLAIAAEQEKSPTTLNVPIVFDNRSLVISITCNPATLVINPSDTQTITFTATKADGSYFGTGEEASIIWNAVLYYDGKDINDYASNSTPFYSVSGNVLTLDPTGSCPLETAGVYQLYVTAKFPMAGATDPNDVVISSQTFNITIGQD